MNRALRLGSMWLPVVIWCSVIFYLSSVPFLQTDLGIWDLILRKAAHMFEFGMLFLLARRAVSGSGLGWSANELIFAAALFSFFYAVSDEGHQAFVAGRSASTIDVCVDAAGIALAFGSVKLFRK